MPITMALDSIVNHGANPIDVVEKLMSRAKKSEVSEDVLIQFFEKKKAERK